MVVEITSFEPAKSIGKILEIALAKAMSDDGCECACAFMEEDFQTAVAMLSTHGKIGFASGWGNVKYVRLENGSKVLAMPIRDFCRYQFGAGVRRYGYFHCSLINVPYHGSMFEMLPLMSLVDLRISYNVHARSLDNAFHASFRIDYSKFFRDEWSLSTAGVSNMLDHMFHVHYGMDGSRKDTLKVHLDSDMKDRCAMCQKSNGMGLYSCFRMGQTLVLNDACPYYAENFVARMSQTEA